VTPSVSAFESIVAAGTPFTRAQAESLLADPDLVSVGMLGEQARTAGSGNRVAYGRVLLIDDPAQAKGVENAGEIRLVGAPASVEEALARVAAAAVVANGRSLTGFSLAALLNLAGGDHLALSEIAGLLRRAGLDAVGELPLDQVGDTENAIEVVRAALHGGLAVRRATIERADIGARLDLIERAVKVQDETSALRAFAPLPRQDPSDLPATGYDDVRTIAAARLMARSIPFIQVDWALYGPKLAQVAIAYGANDIDGVAVTDALNLGHRRSPKEDIERQIRAAACVPVERDGRYEWPA
jgi:aminodeoxyfutalosine synthase